MLAASRDTLERVWRDLLPSGSRCALTLYPDHWNAGDAAIWWGTRTLLETLGVSVDYACDPWSYDPSELQSAVPEGPILLLGGGNFGDVYQREHDLRARILDDFADRRIVQLPQSIWFHSADGIERMAATLARQTDFTLLLRDAASLAFARDRFPGVTARLCPDAAIALRLGSRLREADAPVMALWRGDGESAGTLPPVPDEWIVGDWVLNGRDLPAADALALAASSRRLRDWLGKAPDWPAVPHDPNVRRRQIAWRHLPRLWDILAEDRTLRGLRILSRGRVVLTNRLHAHLLCLLAGIPHVACDTTNGKLFGYRDTWWPAEAGVGAAPRVRFARSPEEAVAMAIDLARET